MPRYYFDVFDGTDTSRDELGLELADFEAALTEARRAAADMSRELMLDNLPGPIEVTIRDHSEGPALFSVTWTTHLQSEDRTSSRPK